MIDSGLYMHNSLPNSGGLAPAQPLGQSLVSHTWQPPGVRHHHTVTLSEEVMLRRVRLCLIGGMSQTP